MNDFHKPGQPGQAAALPETYVQHPLSAAFPRMTPEEFQELKDSIEVLGVQNPITLHDGMVIDGWHRYTAAREVGLPCPVVELAQDIDPREFVVAQNKARRHVTKAQLAIATTAVYQWKPHGDQRCTLNVDRVKSTAEMASIAGVHPNSITQAKAVTAQAAPAVVEAVKRGELGLPKAAAIAKLPREQQAQAISKPLPRPVVVVPPPPSSAAPDPWADLPKGNSTVPEDVNPDDYGPTPQEIAEAEAQLAARHLACLPLDTLAPGLDPLLALRPRLGLRNSSHTLAKILDPAPGHSVRVVSVTHPEYLERLHTHLVADGGVAMLLRGTEGEAFANPRRRPQLQVFANGAARVAFPAEEGGTPPVEGQTDSPEVSANATRIRAMLASSANIPQPILDQVQALRELSLTPRS